MVMCPVAEAHHPGKHHFVIGLPDINEDGIIDGEFGLWCLPPPYPCQVAQPLVFRGDRNDDDRSDVADEEEDESQGKY